MATQTATQTVRVEFVNKVPRQNIWERIEGIAGHNPGGTMWYLPLNDAIAGIEAGKWAFYVQVGYFTVKVIIGKSPYGHKYLKTESDTTTVDNLLSLPQYP